jgi:hypothetical protein
LGTSSTLNAPSGPSATVLLPAATGLFSAVVNAGQEIRTVPEAGAPSARYTTSEIRLVAGIDAGNIVAGIIIAANNKSRPRRHASSMDPPATYVLNKVELVPAMMAGKGRIAQYCDPKKCEAQYAAHSRASSRHNEF